MGPSPNCSHGSDEGDESDEGFSEEGLCDDCKCGVPVCSRDHWSEDKGRKRHHGSDHGHSAEELKKTGSFKLAGMLNMKLKKKPATPARKGINPFTKEPCVFKAKPE